MVLLDVSEGSFTFDVANYWLYDEHEQLWVTRAYMGLGQPSQRVEWKYEGTGKNRRRL